MADLAEIAARLIDIPSVTGSEAALADHVESRVGMLREVTRLGDAVVAPPPLPVPLLRMSVVTVPAKLFV